MPKLRKRLTTLTLGVCAGLLLLPAAGQAATNFGSRLDHDPTTADCGMFGSCTIVSFIHPSDPDLYSGGAPVDGVITKFRIRAQVASPSQVTFRVADISRPNPMDDSVAVATGAGTGPTVSLEPTAEAEVPIREFPGRLPVKKGQHLALDGTNVEATYNSGGDQFSYVYGPPLANGGAARTSEGATGQLLVAATIEPDADGDGFGDETQDRCPSQATTQGACDTTAPGVKDLGVKAGKVSYDLSEAATVRFALAKKLPGRKVGAKCVRPTPRNRSHKRCPRLKAIGQGFDGSGKAGGNQVAIPGWKKLTPGTYLLTMTARDVAGNQSTKTTTFTIPKKKKKKK